MIPNFEPFKLKRLTKEFIEQNKEKIFDSWVKAWEDSYWGELEGFILDEEIEYSIKLAERGYSYGILDPSDKIIGFGSITVENFPKPKNQDEKELFEEVHKKFGKLAYFHELSLFKKYRGKGLGSKLTKVLLQHAKDDGCNAVLLWTEYNSKSQYLYKKHGFEIVMDTVVDKPKHPSKKEHRLFMLKVL